MTDSSTNMRLKLPITCFILEIILIILFGTLVQYDYETDAKEWHNTSHKDYENDFYFRYPSESSFRVRGHSLCKELKQSLLNVNRVYISRSQNFIDQTSCGFYNDINSLIGL